MERFRGLIAGVRVPWGSNKYLALPENITQEQVQQRQDIWADRHRRVVKATLFIMILVAVLWFAVSYMRSAAAQSCDDPKDGFTCSPEISQFWGQQSPFFSVKSEIARSFPDGCEVTFAQMLSRHGARDPTAGKTATYKALVDRIHANVTTYGANFTFIKDYQYTLGADQLTTFGQQELVNSGFKFYMRYQKLASTAVPFVRASGQERVIESGRNWTQGFHTARLEDTTANSTDGFPYDILEISEADNSNNTLNHELCTAFETGPNDKIGDNSQNIWRDIFTPPITQRLNENLPGANLTNDDTINIMDLCPFNTVANDQGQLSSFCALFTEDEWQSYDYYQTLGKYYAHGPGNPLGPTQGVGFTNELIARMTNKPVVDHTTTNSTLDGNNITFPLGRTLYADFSHDNDMVGIYSAMNLFPAEVTPPLSNTTRTSAADAGGFSSAFLVPFSARMYVEKLQCGAGAEEMVRVLINDRVIPLQGCGADALGMCGLNAWVQSLSFATSGGLWDSCFSAPASTPNTTAPSVGLSRRDVGRW